jgi:hypothetical protein
MYLEIIFSRSKYLSYYGYENFVEFLIVDTRRLNMFTFSLPFNRVTDKRKKSNKYLYQYA